MTPTNSCRKREPSAGKTEKYDCYDVKITKLVHEFDMQQKQLHYANRFGKKLTVPVKW